MLGWNDVRTGLDPVGLAQRRLALSRTRCKRRFAIAGQAAAFGLLAAVGQKHGVGNRGALPGLVPAGFAGGGDGAERAAARGVRAQGSGFCGAAACEAAG